MNIYYEIRENKFFIGEMTRYPFPLHLHEEAEIVVVTAGKVRIGIDGILYDLEEGDAAVVFPLTPHSYAEIGENASGVVAIFPSDVIPEYAGTFHGLAPDSPVLRADRSGEDLRAAVLRLQDLSMEENLPLCVAYLHVMLASVLHRLSYRPVYDYNEQNLGCRIMRYVSAHACEEMTLETVSHALGISVSHLSHFFAEKLNTRFRSFVNANRIAKARLMMRDPGMSLTMICDACGYTSMRTFRRAFLTEVGCLPSEHLRVLRNRMNIHGPGGAE